VKELAEKENEQEKEKEDGEEEGEEEKEETQSQEKEGEKEGKGEKEQGSEAEEVPKKTEAGRARRVTNRQSKVVIRVGLEGFGEIQWRSYAINPQTKTLEVCLMVAAKLKMRDIEAQEYAIFVVKNGLERMLDVDEEILTAETNIEKFVYKKNYENEGKQQRQLLISSQRSQIVIIKKRYNI